MLSLLALTFLASDPLIGSTEQVKICDATVKGQCASVSPGGVLSVTTGGAGGGTSLVAIDGGTVSATQGTTPWIVQGWIVIDAGSQPIPVTGTFWQATQPISATSLPLPSNAAQETGGNLATIATNTGSDATAANQTNGNQKTQVTNFPSSQAVTGTFWQSTQPVSIASMPSTPVTGTFWQSTQPVSIASMPSTPVTGTFWQAVQPTQDADAGVSLAQVAGLLTQLLSNPPAPRPKTNLAGVTLIDGSRVQQPVLLDPASYAALQAIASANQQSAAQMTSGQQIVQVASAPLVQPLNPFLPRCNAVKRSQCQP